MNTEREKVREQKRKETCMGGGGRERWRGDLGRDAF
jgi:hypothetical protein